MKKRVIFCLIVFSVILTLYPRKSTMVIENMVNDELIRGDTIEKKHTVLRDYVPDEVTAKKIAEAVWLPIYGEKILSQRPYEAELADGIWIVKGLIPLPYREEPEWRGGTAYIEIQKKDCKVLRVSHGR